MENSKVAKLSDVTKIIKNGSSVAIGGSYLSNRPMAVVRQIIRSNIKNLTLIQLSGSMDTDMLIGAGCLKKLIFSFVSMEAFGLPMNFRRAIEQGELPYVELTGLAMIYGFEATCRGVPFLPYRGPFGSDIVKVNPEYYKRIKCPFTNEELMAISAIEPDVAIIHARRADPSGNVQMEGGYGSDIEMVRSAKKVIVSVEEIVSIEEIRKIPEKTTIPRFQVDMVIETPYGCHPGAHIPRYCNDTWHLMREYVPASSNPDSFKEYLNRYVMKPEDEYLKAIGGSEKLKLLEKLVKEVKWL